MTVLRLADANGYPKKKIRPRDIAVTSDYPKTRAAVTSNAAAMPSARLADRFVNNLILGLRANPPALNIATTAIPTVTWLMVEVIRKN